MDEPVTSDSRLEVSVSFGRFENDGLSWEKWSSFSPNKYLEEVGSLSTPGSVAQKKAYFEAHYKKVAAKKAEQLEIENATAYPVTPSPQDELTHLENSSSGDATMFGICNGGNSGSPEICRDDTAVDDDVKSIIVVEQAACANDIKEKDVDATSFDIPKPVVQEVLKDIDIVVDDSEGLANEEAVLVGGQILHTDPHKFMEHPLEREDIEERLTEVKHENSKLNPKNVGQKVTPTKMERNSGDAKRKGVSPAVKPSQVCTPKSSFHPSPVVSVSRSGKKNMNASLLPKSKTVHELQSKRASPTSLHMSVSLGSSAAFALARKSLIMERMGDKDIVKRAFKSFKNRVNGYPNDEKSSTLEQVSSTAHETKIPPSLTPKKENKGLTKDAEKVGAQKNRSIHQLKPFPPGSNKSYGVDRKSTTTVSPSVNSKSEDRKSISKVDRESEMRKLRQSLNFKATPLPSFYGVQGKGCSEQEIVGSKTSRQRPASSKRP